MSTAVSDRSPIDVTSWIGAYPFRELPHPDPDVLARVLAREGFAGAWVGHLPGAFHRDPVPSNRALYSAVERWPQVLLPAPIVRPDWPGWQDMLHDAISAGAPSVRAYPAQWGLGPGHPALSELAYACGEAGVVLHVTVRFEDLRQRHPLDTAGDVPAATLRGLARLPGSRCHMVVAGAGRDLIEETHWGLTEAEQQRVFYDFGWVWGPPEDHFAHLVRTLGPSRLTWSSWWPLRLTQQSQALIELLPAGDAPANGAADFADGRAIAMAATRQIPADTAGTTPREPRLGETY